MELDLSAHDLLTTTRSVRKRLDLNRPVERSVILDCIEIAQQAPTGSNSQTWHWVVVADPSKKSALAEIYATYFDPYIDMGGTTYAEGDPRARRADAVRSSAQYLRDNFAAMPALVIPCTWGRLTGEFDNFATSSFYGGILPAVWSFMLALRSKGLGSAWTTLHLPGERDAAELLGIPYDSVTQVGLFPVAYTIGTSFKPAARVPAEDLTHWDSW